jgi:hypothetical protein
MINNLATHDKLKGKLKIKDRHIIPIILEIEIARQ